MLNLNKLNTFKRDFGESYHLRNNAKEHCNSNHNIQ